MLYLEDANDLAAWRTRPPLVVIDGQLVGQSQVPPLAEWLADLRPDNSANLGAMGGAVGNLLGIGV